MHSDIKPVRKLSANSNLNPLMLLKEKILVAADERAKIGGFGSARMEATDSMIETTPLHRRGTIQYWAPELKLLHGKTHSKETDIWAFGLTVDVRRASVLVTKTNLKLSHRVFCPPKCQMSL